MFVFVLQVRHAVVEDGPLYLFALFSAIVWSLWAMKVLLSRRYRPWTDPHEATASVIIPVVDEPLDLFRAVLRRIVAQRPTEIIVVINGRRNVGLEQVCSDYADAGVSWTWTALPGKRNAVRVGVEQARGDILVLVDSDTVWTADTLPELLKPFADPTVGGVTTRQRILEPQRRFITRWADWLENSRARYSMPAQSVLGQVGCLPGRTIAFRREIVQRALPEFLHGRFLGVHLEISDDRTLTNQALKQGFRTVYQSTSLVYTDAPLQLRRLYRQQLRWARGSQYNTLRMLPWMLRHAPVLAVFFLADIVLPFLLLGALIGAVYRYVTDSGLNFYTGYLDRYGFGPGLAAVIALTLLASGVSMAIRQFRHLRERPSDALRMPLFVIVCTLFLVPVRLIGFFRMGHVAGWGTRRNAYAGGEDLIARLEGETSPPPLDVVDRGPAAGRGAVTVTAQPVIDASPYASVRRHRSARRGWNPLASVPYLIGVTLITLEVLYRG